MNKMNMTNLFLNLGIISLLIWIAGIALNFDEKIIILAAVSMIFFLTLGLDFSVINFKIDDNLDKNFLTTGKTKIFKDYFIYKNKKIKYDEIKSFKLTEVDSQARGVYLEVVLQFKNGEYLHDENSLYEEIINSDEKLKWRFLNIYLKYSKKWIFECETINEKIKKFVIFLALLHCIGYILFLFDNKFFYLFAGEFFLNITIAFYLLKRFENVEKCYKYKKMYELLENNV